MAHSETSISSTAPGTMGSGASPERSIINKMRFKLLYSGFETCIARSTQGGWDPIRRRIAKHISNPDVATSYFDL